MIQVVSSSLCTLVILVTCWLAFDSYAMKMKYDKASYYYLPLTRYMSNLQLLFMILSRSVRRRLIAEHCVLMCHDDFVGQHASDRDYQKSVRLAFKKSAPVTREPAGHLKFRDNLTL